MAGDWIKMRGNLWDDPRVSALVDATDSSEAAVVGGLYWLWATADQHTEDGTMPGLTVRQIDRKTGLLGFGQALVSIGWLADHPEGVRIVNFEEHNGASAKKRCQTAKRVAKHETTNAPLTQPALVNGKTTVSPALARGREEEEIEKEGRGGIPRATCADAAAEMQKTGLQGVDASHPRLSLMLSRGITQSELVAASLDAVQRKKPFPYALATADGRRRDWEEAGPVYAVAPALDPDSRSAVEAEGESVGLGRWNETEQWWVYKSRVRSKSQPVSSPVSQDAQAEPQGAMTWN